MFAQSCARAAAPHSWSFKTSPTILPSYRLLTHCSIAAQLAALSAAPAIAAHQLRSPYSSSQCRLSCRSRYCVFFMWYLFIIGAVRPIARLLSLNLKSAEMPHFGSLAFQRDRHVLKKPTCSTDVFLR